jgi:hypothetical protein
VPNSGSGDCLSFPWVWRSSPHIHCIIFRANDGEHFGASSLVFILGGITVPGRVIAKQFRSV